MAGRRKNLDLPLYDTTPSNSEDEEESESPPFCRPCCWGVCACALTTSILLGALTLYLVPGIQFKQPHWTVKSLIIDRVDLPAINLEGLVAADTRECPPEDPCGLTEAKGCSKCPEADMWNDGCICKRGAKRERSGQGSSASPGTIVRADTAACPLLDTCGVITGVSCSKCPDSSWINDGCTCRQPLSADEFFKGLEGFLALLAGNTSSIVQMTLQVGVEVTNPNVLGAQTDAGEFTLRYKGTPIGSAKTEPRSIGANDTFPMSIAVQVDSVPADVAMQMTQELLEENNQLSMRVDGKMHAQVGLLRVTCGVACDLRIDASKLPATVFTKEACKYSYGV
uniref:Late embryogenesis abundant protein LEA-2 subgroup domain-containing protein n=1 Tax=Alexandrium catenella TaxID=2925 RepID=A0A7S1S944_ALECA|mmetsp:Transcript_9141/g.24781  ORF Transcript_9141/g.24781 Transcript_9141/m.24781 type:complete len:339 (+) Transcript_9141:70-1086(+)